MSVHAAVTEYLRRRVALWERRRTERFISNLPLEVRKDIGWPSDETPARTVARMQNSLWERRW